MIFFTYGTDHYRLNQKLHELKTGFIQKRDQAGLNVINLEGEKLDFDHFKQEVMTVPFLGEKKMIVIKNLFKNPQNQTFGKQLHKDIANFIKEKGDQIENIICFADYLDPEKFKFSAGKPIALAGPLFKVLLVQKFRWEFNLLDNRELGAWLKTLIQEQKIKIETTAANELIIRVGNDLNHLTLEIDKLAAFKKGEEIKKTDVENMVLAKFDDNIFNLVDAIGQKNRQLSLKLISQQLSGGTHPLQILKMISRQFKILLQISGGATPADSGLHPFVFKKTSLQAKNFNQAKLIEINQKLLALEAKLKSGHKNPELLFDLFITKNC